MTARAVRVCKMSGAGNDFLVLESEEAGRLGLEIGEWARRACRRGLSAGADGVLVVGRSGPGRVRVEFRNPDGTPAFCGNGSRCAARYAALHGWTGSRLTLETIAGDVAAEVNGASVTVTLPVPDDRGEVEAAVGTDVVRGRSVAAGAPHFVVEVASARGAPLEVWGPALRRHPIFGDQGTNVDVVERVADAGLVIRTWERGVEGETLACGSGAVAAAFAARIRGGGAEFRVVPRSGVPLRIRFVAGAGSRGEVLLEGDARVVFEGSVPEEGIAGYPL